MNRLLTTSLIGLLTALSTSAAEIPADVRNALKELRQYDHSQPRAPLFTLEQFVARSTGKPEGAEIAAMLTSMLTDPGSSFVAKVIMCQQLANVGTDAQVPTLAKLLDDPQLSDPARYALEGMQSATADAALRSTLQRLGGKQLIGVINSLADRRDKEAVPAFEKLLTNADPAVVMASANALAVIASKQSSSAIEKSGDVDVRLRYAQKLAAGGETAEAVQICQKLCAAGQPADQRVAALCVLSRTASPAAESVVLAAIGDADSFVSSCAIRFAGNIKSADATAGLVQKLKNLDPQRQVLVLGVLAERRDTAARSAVEELATSANEDVRTTALATLGSVGNAQSLKLLATVAAGEKGRLQSAANEALASLVGDEIDGAISGGVSAGTPAARTAMIGAAAARNLTAAIPSLLKATRDADESVRVAAAQALSRISRAEDYESIVSALLDARDAPTRDALSAAVASVGKRIDDQQARTTPLLAALKGGNIAPEGISSILKSLAGIGGTNALAAVTGKMKSDNETVRDAAIRALADWPDGAALTCLEDLVKSSPNPVQKAIALRGLLRLAQQDKDRGACPISGVLDALKTVDEKRLALGALSSIHNSDAIIVAKNLLSDEHVNVEAAAALVQISRALLKVDPALVADTMTEVMAAVPDSSPAKEVLAEARKLLGAKSESGRARRETIAKTLPAGQRLVAYIDCGVERADKGPNGETLTVARGQDFDWKANGDAGNAAASTVAFGGGEVAINASGLDGKKRYSIGFTWWDYDDNKREESVWVSGKQIVAKTALPSWKGKEQGPATVMCTIPADATRAGRIEIIFKREGAGNCVVSELWLIEGEVENSQTVTTPATKPLFPGRTNPGAAKKALIVTGMEYPGHKWRETAPFVRDTISADKRISVAIDEDAKTALESPTLGQNDVIVLNYMNWENPGPGDAAQEGLRRAVANGTGLVLVHFACGAFQSWPEFVKIAGRVWNPKFRGHDPRGPFEVNIVDAQHEITKGFAKFGTDDELYTCLDGATPIHVLADANSKVDHKDYPMAFVLQYGKGRVFMSTLGHDVKALSFPDVKNLYRRATAWAAGLPPEG